MKSELLVIADQHCCGEYVPGPCTTKKREEMKAKGRNKREENKK